MTNYSPYHTIQSNPQAYSIMLRHDQQGASFEELAQEFGVPEHLAADLYYRTKIRQLSLYINQITLALGHPDTDNITRLFDFYDDAACVAAYLEKEYSELLTEFRQGEPGMPPEFLASMPPFKPSLSKEEIARVIELRETEKLGYAEIAEQCGLTKSKARRVYDEFYLEQVLAMVEALQSQAKTEEEQLWINARYLSSNFSPKSRYERLIADQALSAGQEDAH